MNIKEYIKLQSEVCPNSVVKTVFNNLLDIFYPKPLPKVEPKQIPFYPSKTVKKEEDSFSKRKVRVSKMPNGKPSIGLIVEDGIKLPNKQMLTFALCDYYGRTFYYGLERLFYRDNDSRILTMIDKSNYEENRENVEVIRDCVLDKSEVLRIE